GARAALADAIVGFGAARHRHAFDTGATAVRCAIAIRVVAGDTARISRARPDGAGARAPVARAVTIGQDAHLLARLARTPAIESFVLIARSGDTRRATTHVIQRVVGLAITIVVRRRAAIPVLSEDGSHTVSPLPAYTGSRTELADAFF